MLINLEYNYGFILKNKKQFKILQIKFIIINLTCNNR